MFVVKAIFSLVFDADYILLLPSILFEQIFISKQLLTLSVARTFQFSINANCVVRANGNV